MGIDRFLNHRVSILRRVASGADEYEQPIVSEETLASAVAAGIQPRTGREVDSVSGAGAALSDHVIYMLPRDVTTADVVLHEQAACTAANDLPDGRYEIVATPDAAGGGHHLELAAKLVSAPAFAAPVGS